ncbi:MAG: DUF3098 domain-containing protein [Candidatus Marinimicrobia bacterium]|jgi:hypothetical protein|nr:DUF3098 domain-containing protein [Candidatus Neomarinimicrobiota bacterium]MBT3634105.1 DUF3098 domain-containing protein [Candidatus Neomarinimicrobiota bacterium]MBT3759887.1 DUF3098 domain-containing protein [Candidatus Neomarinimicrobiota bacterium]MBT4537765.1 DUF3098 domain-containing protein [Candidatus Neomarinimicrobiota bacterium]MBT4852202.1 DUF3098 domain-containing protein [Candidatus Neomarinimicrobiota bacterium]
MVDNNTENSNLFSSWDLSKFNYWLFGIGILIIILGYIIMYSGETTSFQSVTLAPFVLVVGYCVIIPIAILYKPKSR